MDPWTLVVMVVSALLVGFFAGHSVGSKEGEDARQKLSYLHYQLKSGIEPGELRERRRQNGSK